MLGRAITFLVIAIMAGLLGLSWITGPAAQIAWSVCGLGMALFLACLMVGYLAAAP